MLNVLHQYLLFFLYFQQLLILAYRHHIWNLLIILTLNYYFRILFKPYLQIKHLNHSHLFLLQDITPEFHLLNYQSKIQKTLIFLFLYYLLIFIIHLIIILILISELLLWFRPQTVITNCIFNQFY